MNFDWTDEELAFANEVRTFIADNLPASLTDDLQEGEAKEIEVFDDAARAWEKKMFDKGWAVLDLPPEYGQPSLNAMQRYLLLCELDYSNAPKFTRATTVSVIPTIARLGTDQNKAMWMDKLASADVTVSIGYSEPSAGSDLAALRTSARREGDEWIVNGQKTWNSRGSTASHIWLLARTGEPGGRHKGLSMFMVPLNSKGVHITDIKSWGDHAFAEVFFDEVRVPAENLIGQEGGGWAAAMGAVGGERMFGGFANGLRKLFDDLVDHCRTTAFEGETLASRPEVQQGLARLAVDIEMADLVSIDICSRVDAGQSPDAEALGLKIFSSELRTRLSDFAMQVLGLPGLYNFKEPTAPVKGDMELLYRRSPPARLGMGANEVLRDVVAQRGLGLPRG